MDSAAVTALTTAFDPTELLATFQLFAPYIIGVVGVIVGISLVRWGYHKIRSLLSRGV